MHLGKIMHLYMNQSILFLVVGKWFGRLDWATSLGERKLEIQTSFILIKNFVASCL